MGSRREYLEYVLELLRDTPNITYRQMMGEFVLYSQGVVFGGVYDDRFLLKQTPASLRLLPDSELCSPYPGAKEMLLVETADPVLVATVVRQMLSELPAPKAKK